MEQYWSQYGSLRSTTGYWSPSRHGAIDHDSLDATTPQFLIHPMVWPSTPSNSERRTWWRTRSEGWWWHMSSMMIWNHTGPSMDCRGTPRVTGLHLDMELLSMTLWMPLSTQFLIHPMVQLERGGHCGGPGQREGGGTRHR